MKDAKERKVQRIII